MTNAIHFDSPATLPCVLALVLMFVVVFCLVRIAVGRSHRLSKRWPIRALRGLFLSGLLAILLNPVRVTEEQGAVVPSQVFCLIDSSASMAMGGEHGTRWHQATRILQAVENSPHVPADLRLFQFGRRLKAVSSLSELGLHESGPMADRTPLSAERGEDPQQPSDGTNELCPANDPDTQLCAALRQLTNRFGNALPAAVVVLSDGRTHDAEQAEPMAAAFAQRNVPIHCVPVGSMAQKSDVALISVVLPSVARKHAEVQALAYLRSFGCDGNNTELTLDAVNGKGNRKRLATVPVTLKDGFQAIPINFRTESDTHRLQVAVSEQPRELWVDNNRFDSQIEISRERIRVLYIEGGPLLGGAPAPIDRVTRSRSAFAATLQDALRADTDIECLIRQLGFDQSFFGNGESPNTRTVAELSAFDAIVLSDVPCQAMDSEQLTWIETWVRRRGGGLCMVGGPNSFGSGGWQGSVIEQVLPVKFGGESDWRSDVRVSLHPGAAVADHSLFRLTTDKDTNWQRISNFPTFRGANLGLSPKTDLTTALASARIHELAANGVSQSEFAGITVGQYGHGRTMALATQVTGNGAKEFISWGPSAEDNQYFVQFWQNAIYWLTENSYTGRRRVVGSVDKHHYRPGETITLSSTVFDKNVSPTTDVRLVGVLEPQSFEGLESDYSSVRRPSHYKASAGQPNNALLMWGEEFEIPADTVGGENRFQMELELADTMPLGTASQLLRIELTAYDGRTQLDSISLPVQILHDPFEQQNPLPDHELLRTLADRSGGKVLSNEADLIGLFHSLPAIRQPPQRRHSPLWSNGWVLTTLLGLISAEWCYRRSIGLA